MWSDWGQADVWAALISGVMLLGCTPCVQVPLFQECEDAFIHALVMRLKMTVFSPGESIFQIADVGHDMYFITKVSALCLCMC